MGSPAGQRGNFGQTNYAAAKAGIAAMVRTWAMELARANITVNAIVPVAATAMTETIPAFAPYVERSKRRRAASPTSLRKGEGFGTPEDCAALVAFLASDAARGHHRPGDRHRRRQAGAVVAPEEVAVAYADGGWTADAIAAAWPNLASAASQNPSASPPLPEA